MIDQGNQLFPFCLVWTMIPCISWICPWIGHTGICSSQGVICDFLGYRINKRQMAFGKPLKYVIIDPVPSQQYDYVLDEVNHEYENRGHNLCWQEVRYCSNNCHHHVADVLNGIKYRGRCNWSQVDIWWMCLWQSSYTSKSAIFKTYLPFIGVILAIIFIFLTLRHQQYPSSK